jgi:hypothetical protein
MGWLSDDNLDAVEIFIEVKINLLPEGKIELFLVKPFDNALCLSLVSLPAN